jgi:hypothetical protein
LGENYEVFFGFFHLVRIRVKNTTKVEVVSETTPPENTSLKHRTDKHYRLQMIIIFINNAKTIFTKCFRNFKSKTQLDDIDIKSSKVRQKFKKII